jgi:ABC-type dipeptide/oligopeptide/nickel transport system permease subunit
VLSENPVTLLAALLFACFVLLALVAPYWIVPHDPLASNAAVALQPPSARTGSAPTRWAATSSRAPSWPRGWTWASRSARWR